MDYTGRDDVHHPLLIGFAVVAELTVLTGLVLWLRRNPRWRERQIGARPGGSNE